MKAPLFTLLTFLSTKSIIAQQSCEGKVVPYTVSIAGRTDSASREAILQAGKIESVTSFSPEMIAFIKEIAPGQKLYIDCIRTKNKLGQEYLLKPGVIKISTEPKVAISGTSNP